MAKSEEAALYQITPGNVAGIARSLNATVDAYNAGRMNKRTMESIIMNLRAVLEGVGVVGPLFNFKAAAGGENANGK